ncbi:MAG: enoyl-CoA hydratase [bacterium]|nr:enoyl-CoA hydratase [bacterium]
MGGRVYAEKAGHVGTIVFDHPERRNAISAQMWQEIPAAVASVADDSEVRAVVLRGAGDVSFVSGADISEFEQRRAGGDGAADYDRVSGLAFAALLGIEKPVIGLIHGFCVGGGMAIALSADLRYVADDARFAIPAGRLGLGYSSALLEPLTLLVGSSAAKEILFTARQYDASEALHMGLVNAVKPKAELEDFVAETAGRIAANAPLTLRGVKIAARELAHEKAERDMGAIAAAVRACYDSDDYREGVRAFLEKRRPAFEGH